MSSTTIQFGGPVPTEKEVGEIGNFVADDRHWFGQHPDRSYRIRLATPAEQRLAFSADGSTPSYKCTLVTVVYQLEPGLRSRAYGEYPFTPLSSEWSKLSVADDQYLAALYAYLVYGTP